MVFFLAESYVHSLENNFFFFSMQYSLATVRLGSRLPGRSVVYRSCYKELFLLLPTSERPLCGSEQLY